MGFITISLNISLPYCHSRESENQNCLVDSRFRGNDKKEK